MKEVKIIPDTILVEIPKDPQTLNKYIFVWISLTTEGKKSDSMQNVLWADPS